MSVRVKSDETAVFVEKYKGNKTFSIWNVDEDGDKEGKFPLVAFGLRKAEAILEHLDKLKSYVKKEKARQLEEDEDKEEEVETPNKNKTTKRVMKKAVRRSSLSSDSDED